MSDVLYHYTDANGLRGIVTSGAMWATDAEFLNDAQELTYARELIFGRLEDKIREVDPVSEVMTSDPQREAGQAYSRGHIIRSAMHHLDPGPNHRFAPFGYHSIYVACFCESGDLLSQWRAYGPGGGYAIGFHKDALAGASGPTREVDADDPRGQQIMDDPRLVKIVYGLSGADSLADAVAEEIAPQPRGHPGTRGWYQARAVVLPALATIKHEAFKEEQEWRVLVAGDVMGEGVEFRVGSFGVVPYTVLMLPDKAIAEVVVGPGPHADVRRKGVKKVLISRGLEEVPIRDSRAPLRA